MARRRALTADQHRELAERNLRYLQLRAEAAKHSVRALARELGVDVGTIRNYLGRKVA